MTVELNMFAWQPIETAPKDRVILTDEGTARYVDQRGWGSPVTNGWYLCFAHDSIPDCADEGMSIARMQPTIWMDIPPKIKPLDTEAPVFACKGTVYRSNYSGCSGWDRVKIDQVVVAGAESDVAHLKAAKEKSYDTVSFSRVSITWDDPVKIQTLEQALQFIRANHAVRSA